MIKTLDAPASKKAATSRHYEVDGEFDTFSGSESDGEYKSDPNDAGVLTDDDKRQLPVMLATTTGGTKYGEMVDLHEKTTKNLQLLLVTKGLEKGY